MRVCVRVGLCASMYVCMCLCVCLCGVFVYVCVWLHFVLNDGIRRNNN